MMKRINVIGTSGSGKSHFSKCLADRLAVPYIEMDALFWLPNWTPSSTEDFLELLAQHLSGDTWVLDGNQSATNALKWQYVDTIIWLDYSFFRTFKQIVLRSFQRAYSKKELWKNTGNKETFRRNFLSKDSVILWMLKNYLNTKKKYSKLFNSQCPEHEHISMIRLTSPKDTARFLASIDKLAPKEM
jgi:adenylate kinase family enzyme